MLRALNVLPWGNWNTQANERSIRAVHSQGISDEVELSCVFTGNGTVVCPIPIKDQLTVIASGDQVPVCLERCVSGDVYRHPACLDRCPAGTGQAGRMTDD